MHRPHTRGQAAEAAFHRLPKTSFSGLQFDYRDEHFDWRLLHGIDVDSVIRLTDVRAIEDCLDTLQHGNIEGERGLSMRNCMQLFRLLQLAIEYITHLRNAHALLLTCYSEASATASRWTQAARTYLAEGDAFIDECNRVLAMSMQRLERVDAARADLEEQDRQYNAALDQLEVEDQHVRFFHFRKQRAELSWQQVHAVDLDELVLHVDTATLDKVMHNITFGSILGEDCDALTPHHFAQLIPVAQCALDYVLFQANATGSLLEKGMQRLQLACMDIPALTSATQQLHDRITGYVIEAHSILQQAHQGQSAATMPVALPHSVAHRQPSWSMVQQQQVGLAHTVPALPKSRGRGRSPPSNAPLPQFVWSPTVTVPGSRPNTVGSGLLRPGSASQAAGSSQHLYEDILLSASALGGMGASGLLPPGELQSRTAELHFKVDELEKDLRMERYKTDEIRRILADIKDRIAGSFSPTQRPTAGSEQAGAGTGRATDGRDSGLSAPSSPYRYAGQGTASGRVLSDEEGQRLDGQCRGPGDGIQGELLGQGGTGKDNWRSLSGNSVRAPSNDGSQLQAGTQGPTVAGQVSDGSGTDRGQSSARGRVRRVSTTPSRASRPGTALAPKAGHRSVPSSGHLDQQVEQLGQRITYSKSTPDVAGDKPIASALPPPALAAKPTNAAEGVAFMRAAAAAAAAPSGRPPLPSRKPVMAA